MSAEAGSTQAHHHGLGEALHHMLEARAHQAGEFQAHRKEEIREAKAKLEHEEKEHATAVPEGADAPAAEHAPHGLFGKFIEARAKAAGEFQQKEWEQVLAARARLEEARAAGKKVEARPGLVKISDP